MTRRARTFKFVDVGTTTPTLFSIENKSAEGISFDLSLISELGTSSNPIIIESIVGPYACELTAEAELNYKWIATEGGELRVSTEPIYVFRKGAGTAAPLVKTEGGEGLVGTYTVTLDGGVITLVVTDSTIEVVDESNEGENASGTYSYTVEGESIIVCDAVSGDATDIFSISKGVITVSVTNNRHSHQQVIGEGVDEVVMVVEDGDEIRFVIVSPYDVELILNLKVESISE